jgi:hypothetical protein
MTIGLSQKSVSPYFRKLAIVVVNWQALHPSGGYGISSRWSPFGSRPFLLKFLPLQWFYHCHCGFFTLGDRCRKIPQWSIEWFLCDNVQKIAIAIGQWPIQWQ